MKPPVFSYHDPVSVEDAIALLSQHENAKVLAGGQSLMPMLNMRYVMPDHVIDLNRIESLAYIREDGNALEIGAMTRQRDLEFSDLVERHCPLMHEALLQVGHRQTRNRGTIGGSLSHLDPAAELPAVCAATDAVIRVQGPKGTRDIAFADFPAGYMTPSIEMDEMVIGLRVPSWPAGHGYAFVEFSRRHGDFAVASAAALLEVGSDGKISRASLTVGGVGAAPLRMGAIEQALIGETGDEDRLRDLCESCREINAMGDVYASTEYRQHLATVMSRRALVKAYGRAAGTA
ncbi:MAG: xanthine dehydrogenase family protein subunit M [Proteobacteria bacterium]|nr:xanthine dehydrogenase family protein subunit M [Pseudomonadota bacterium]MDA1325848.1 xanthine dehydrogenase family protein subunit M [Pseudomonadota bacterium]